MKPKITQKIIKELSPEWHGEIRDSDLKGFCLLVSESGSMSFCIRYRINGRAKKYTLGKYGKITVTEARLQAREKLADIVRGVDIQEAKKETLKLSKLEMAKH